MVWSLFNMESQFTSEFFATISQKAGISVWLVTLILFIIFTWTAVWKLLAMWKSAKKGSVIWFVVLALFNTVGILPILYIYVFSKMNLKNVKSVPRKRVKKKQTLSTK